MHSLMVKRRHRAAEHLRMTCVMKKMMGVIRMALTSRIKGYVMLRHAKCLAFFVRFSFFVRSTIF